MPDYPPEYQALRSRLPIDLMAIDEEIMRMPSQVQDAAELSAAASDAENAAHLDYDIARADFAMRLREANPSERITEATIERTMPLDEQVRDARLEYEHARTYATLCGALVSSLRTKSSLLQKASDLMIAGYVTPSSAYERERISIRRARTQESNKAPVDKPRPTLLRRN